MATDSHVCHCVLRKPAERHHSQASAKEGMDLPVAPSPSHRSCSFGYVGLVGVDKDAANAAAGLELGHGQQLVLIDQAAFI